MTPEDLELFKKHFELYECYKKHAFIRNYDKEVYTDLIHLYTTYVNEKHNFSHWCSSCRVELVEYLYGWYVNEENTTWYREQPQEEVVEVPFKTEEPVIENKPIKRRRKPNT
jgi:elongation factor P hydroxylase